LYYTDYGKETGRGILLVSYTWSEDAQRWGFIITRTNALSRHWKNVALIHPADPG